MDFKPTKELDPSPQFPILTPRCSIGELRPAVAIGGTGSKMARGNESSGVIFQVSPEGTRVPPTLDFEAVS